MNDHRIPLEICLTSNVQTRAAAKISATHPLRFYYDYGLRTTINTDNRLMSDTTVTKELYRAHKHMGFSLEEISTSWCSGSRARSCPTAPRCGCCGRCSRKSTRWAWAAKTQQLHTEARAEAL